MLPVVLLAIVWWRQGSLSRRVLIAITPYFALALVFGLMTVWFQKHQAILGVTVQTETPWGKLVGAAQAVWFYLGKALVPVRLCLIYPRWPMNASVGAVALVGLALSFLVGWRFRRSWGRHGLLTLGCFVACLFPVLGFFDMYFLVFARVSDHFAYLPLIAIVTLVAAGLHSVLPHRILPLAGLVLLAALGFLTVQRARVFATDEGLWLDTLAKNPSAWNAHNNLGCILAERNQVDEAMKHFAKSVELNPLNVSAHCNLGKGFVAKGDFAEAEKQFRTALQIRPDHVDTLKCYGSALAGQHRREEAVQQLGEAVRLKPDTETRLQLAPLLAVLGKPHDAIRQWRAVLAVESNSFAAINNLAWVLATAADDSARDGAEAVSLAERACRATGRNDAKPLGTLAAAYAEAGQFTNAVRAAEQAIEVANATGNSGFARINQQLLEIFRSGRPYHEAPPRAPTSP